jgi:hypothetical protein
MSSNKCIIPECYIDSCLVEVLLFADKDHVNHQKGNGTVAREMKSKFDDTFCIGIIDEDRKALDYLLEFQLLTETNHLKLWKHEEKAHYIIQLRPVIEKWILNICENEGILLKDFDLPAVLNQLQKVSKSVTSKNDIRFIRLFKHILRSKSEPVLQLKGWLEYLKTNTFKVDINYLING